MSEEGHEKGKKVSSGIEALDLSVHREERREKEGPWFRWAEFMMRLYTKIENTLCVETHRWAENASTRMLWPGISNSISWMLKNISIL